MTSKLITNHFSATTSLQVAAPSDTTVSEKKEKKDMLNVDTTQPALGALRASLSTLRGNMKHQGGRRGLDQISICLPLYITFNTTAAADYTTPTIVAGWQAATEWASLATLYEEYIIDRYDFVFFSDYVTAYTTSNPQIWALAHDPMSNAALASVANAFQHSQRFIWGQSPSSSSAARPQAVTPDGLFHWHVKIPPKVASSTADANVRGHEWTSTSDTTTNYGYIKPYLTAVGATGTIGFRAMLNMYCRFRSRT